MKNNSLSSLALYTPYLSRIVSLGTSGMHYVALAGLISLALLTTATATDFSGSLKGVTITDAANTNKPPVAVFTYAINGSTVTFDASGSTDSGGKILQYMWDFGEGSTGNGINANHTYANIYKNYNVVLTIVDDKGGVALNNNTIMLSPYRFYSTLDSLSDLTSPTTGIGGTATNDITFTIGSVGNALTKASSTSSGFTIPSTNVSTTAFTIEFDFIPSHDNSNTIFSNWTYFMDTVQGNRTSSMLMGTNGGGADWCWKFILYDDNASSYVADTGFASAMRFTAGSVVHIKIEFNKTDGVGTLYINGSRAAFFSKGSAVTMDANWGRSSSSNIIFLKSGTHTSKIDELKIK